MPLRDLTMTWRNVSGDYIPLIDVARTGGNWSSAPGQVTRPFGDRLDGLRRG